MNSSAIRPIYATRYDRTKCETGVVHLGLGAFHRAHQAVYLDDYMEVTGDLRWGVTAVNLRAADRTALSQIATDVAQHDGYFLKSISADGQVELRRVRSHIDFADWSIAPLESEELLSQPCVHLVTITVTESGYYTDPDGNLDLSNTTIAAEIAGGKAQSVYGYLRAALAQRMNTTDAPITIACCDNIRENGKMLHRNLSAYLKACKDDAVLAWVGENAAFPCSMVDRITPRSPATLGDELSALVGGTVTAPVMAEDFIQWVLQSNAAGPMPDLAQAGVTLTPDVTPYEETKIRILNGGHTALAYLAALHGVATFDAAMRVPELFAHFENFEKREVLPALTGDLPFSKQDYLAAITRRFGNQAIGDTVARICADGMAKFPIFIRPTIEGCLMQDILPVHAIRSIAAWYVFARHVEAGKIPFEYVEPAWDTLKPMLGAEGFLTSAHLWGDIPQTYPQFTDALRDAISEMEAKWPV